MRTLVRQVRAEQVELLDAGALAKAPASADSPARRRNLKLRAAYEAARFEVQTAGLEDLARSCAEHSAAFACVLLRAAPERVAAGIRGPDVGARNAYERAWRVLRYGAQAAGGHVEEHGVCFWRESAPVRMAYTWQNAVRRFPGWLHLHELAGRGLAFCGTVLLPDFRGLTVYRFPREVAPHTLLHALEACAMRTFRAQGELDQADLWKGGGL